VRGRVRYQPAMSRAAQPSAPSAVEPRCGLLRVGELAERSGKTVRAVRFYEEMGLLEPISRTTGGFREYDDNALLRIQWIDRLQELGFSLADIRAFLSTLRAEEQGPAAMDQLRTFYAKKLIETRQSISRLQLLEKELKESLSYLHACQACAPATPRTACPSCNDGDHQGAQPPPLIAAVHDPRPASGPETRNP